MEEEEKVNTGIYIKEQFETNQGILQYRILYPNGFDAGKQYPVLLFLHGAGERGSDNEIQLIHGGEIIKKGMDIHQSIAIFPQCAKDDYWIKMQDTELRENGLRDFEPDISKPPSQSLSMVMKLMQDYTQKDYVDKSRIYVAGLSMGGMGTFDLCWRMPDMFAAASVICGAGSTDKAEVISSLPIRIYHGEDDSVVSVEESREMIKAIEDVGGKPQVFIYKGVDHNSWVNAFLEPDFLSWMYDESKF